MDLPLRGGVREGRAPLLAVFLLVMLALATSPAEATPSKLPPGAVKVAPLNVASIAKGVWCAKAPGRWKSYLPGRKILIRRGKRTRTYFVTALQQARNSSSTRQAKRFEKTHRRYLKSCRAVQPLRFSFRKAIGIARGKKKRGKTLARAATPESNLQTILPSGALRDAVVSGGVNVLGYWFSPNGNIFLEIEALDLSNATYLPSDGGCAFIEVDRASGLPSCVDSEVTSILVAANSFGEEVQFDSTGNVYYGAIAGNGQTSRPVLRRRSPDGVITQLSDGALLESFQLLPDDSVLAIGYDRCRPPSTCSDESSWLKRFTAPPSESEETLLTVDSTSGPQTLLSGLLPFPDGNVYFSLADPGPYPGSRTKQRILRYLTSEKRLDSRPWISVDPNLSPNWPLLSVCTSAATQASLWPCASTLPTNPGSPAPDWFEPTLYWGNNVATPNGEVFVAASDSFYRAFPSLSIIRTSETLPLVGTPSAQFCISSTRETIIFCGGDENGSNRNVIMELDLSSGVEKTLLGPESGLAPYQVGVTSSGEKAIFVAGRAGERVMGQIDLKTDEVSVVKTLEYDLIDFLIFGGG